MSESPITFIDLFAGIGGFHLALHNLEAKCVFVSEWDKHARQTYQENFKKIQPDIFNEKQFVGDITKVSPKDIPDFNILTGGFPCQPFSQAGHKKGFDDIRGTLFFNIAEILRIKQPEAFFIENVRGLRQHDGGKTFARIKEVIESLGYSFHADVFKASDYGLPTHRPRLFMVGFKDRKTPFSFPNPQPLKFTLSDLFKAPCNKDIGFTLRVGGRGSGLHDRRNWDSYLVNGKEHRITVDEAKTLMGFPEDFKFPVSNAQAMKQLGNSVAVAAIQATAEQILKSIRVQRALKAQSEDSFNFTFQNDYAVNS